MLSVQDHGTYHHDVPSGEEVLVVQRRPGQLAVWRQGRPDDVAAVAVQDDYSTLRVRPWRWAIDMPVQLTGEWAAGWSGGVSAAPRSNEETVLLRGTKSSTYPTGLLTRHGHGCQCWAFQSASKGRAALRAALEGR